MTWCGFNMDPIAPMYVIRGIIGCDLAWRSSCVLIIDKLQF